MKTLRLWRWMPWLLIVGVVRVFGIPDASTWTEPRVFHEPFDGAFAERVTVAAGKPETRMEEAVMSANEAYWFRLTGADGQEPKLMVSAGAGVWRISFKDAYMNFPVEARWVNEKILFFRVYWGRVVGSDYLFDAEIGKVIHREMVHDGTLLFQQTQTAKDQASRRTAGIEAHQERTMLLPKHPRCVDLARVANRFFTLGEEGMIKELTAWADEHRRPHGVESNVSEQIGWVCRLMYLPRKDATLRPPGFGGLMLPFNTLRPEDWPAYPLAESGGIFFVLAQSYMLAGVAEDPVNYLVYCRKAGRFRQEPLRVPTGEEARTALDALLGRELWKQIRWRDAGSGFSYEMQESSVVDFLKKQTFPSEADEDVEGLRLTRELKRVQDYRVADDGWAATIKVLGRAAPPSSPGAGDVNLSAAFDAPAAPAKAAH